MGKLSSLFHASDADGKSAGAAAQAALVESIEVEHTSRFRYCVAYSALMERPPKMRN